MPFRRSKNALIALAATGMLSGCADYLNHRDTITFGAGNAVEANKGIHIKEPFPAAAQNTRIQADGRVIYRAVRSYQTGMEGPWDSLSTTSREAGLMGTDSGNGTNGQ